ncbi:PD-(D/E)XK nuclease family protein [Lacticaseibacillus hulanensis]|uniref:PD-(D/E)XK nuclease family protein n=1 Tax=Lacticaseibacillus hulanensis TaxID=2493111 RepID=UPI000FDBF9D1|nr:PD-(D/E)XK nuclease family protein [Lacticaseibacillus hulanensis]
MGLNFVLGDGLANHEAVLTEKMVKVLKQNPNAQILYLVPNHLKFESEIDVLGNLAAALTPNAKYFASSRVQVMSFTRLAWYYLNGDAIFQQPRLTPAASSMQLAKIMSDHRDELRIFAGQVDNPGFTAKLQRQLDQLALGGITSFDLRGAIAALVKVPAPTPDTDMLAWRQEVLRSADGDRHLPKLLDLATILAAYEQETSGLLSTADLLLALNAHLEHMDLRNTYVFINHFNVFAAREQAVVNTLIHRAQETVVALTTDRPGIDQPTPPDLFFPAKRLYHRLHALAAQPLNDMAPAPIRPDNYAPARKLQPGIQNLGKYFKAATALRDSLFPQDKFIENGDGHVDWQGITIAKASTTYTELRTVARDIRQHVQQDGARMRDFLVLARHLAPYSTKVQAVFNEFDLPVFIDRERQMNSHPLVAFIDNLFALLDRNFDYQSVFGLLRTELLVPHDMPIHEFRHAIDITENFVLATGIRGQKRWLDPTRWVDFRLHQHPVSDDVVAEDDDAGTVAINQIHDLVRTTIGPLMTTLKGAKTGRDLATAVYQFLEEVGVRAQITNWRNAANDAGDLARAQGEEQAWSTLCTLFDDFVSVWGEREISATQFVSLLDAGFGSATYTQIPSTLDQVVVSETGLTRIARAKYVYIIGATSLVMPDTIDDKDILTSDDRHVLGPVLPSGCFLPDAGADAALTEPFINYLVFVAPTTELTISYPVREEGENEPSAYVTGLQAAANLSWQIWNDATPDDSVGKLIGTSRSLLSDRLTILRALKDTKTPIAPSWTAVGEHLRKTTWQPLLVQLDASLDYTNSAGHLEPHLAEELYGRHLAVSISRLETFYKNPFEYFVKYGLALTPRREFTLTPADTGTLYHAVMQQLLAEAQKRGGLFNMSSAEVDATVQQLVRQLIEQPEFAVLTSSARMQFITQMLQNILRRSAWAVHKEQQASSFKVAAEELDFGMGSRNSLPALDVPIDSAGHQHVLVRGRIDRLDEYQAGDQTEFMVVDYKSSARKFSPQDAYFGLGMQMLTYIAAVSNAGSLQQRALAPAGGVFMHLFNPRLPYQAGINTETKDDLLLPLLQMQGIIVGTDSLPALDTTLTDETGALRGGQSSPFFPLKLKKDATPAATTPVVTPAQIELLLDNNTELIRLAAAQILAGVIELAPARYDQKADSITKSDYTSIMQFDPALTGNRYRELAKLSLKDVLARLVAGERPYTDQDFK